MLFHQVGVLGFVGEVFAFERIGLVVVEFDGLRVVAEDGTVLYVFDRIGHEEDAATRERALRGHPAGGSGGASALGEVIFDSGEPAV